MIRIQLKAGDKINIIKNAPLSYRKTPLDETTAYTVTENDIKVMTDNKSVQFLNGEIQSLKEKPAREPRKLPPHIEIRKLKHQLSSDDSPIGDYKAIKYAEGLYTDSEFAPIKAEREAVRKRIRELEGIKK